MGLHLSNKLARSEVLRNTLTSLATMWRAQIPGCCWSAARQGKPAQKGQSGAGGDSKVLPDKGRSRTLSEEGECPMVQSSPDKSTVTGQVWPKAMPSSTPKHPWARTGVHSLNAAPLSTCGGPGWGFSHVSCFPRSLIQGFTATPDQSWPWPRTLTPGSGETPQRLLLDPGLWHGPFGSTGPCSDWGWRPCGSSVEVKSSQELLLSIWRWLLYLCS